MPDSMSRTTLMQALDKWDGVPVDDNWPVDANLIQAWWDEYKDWEEAETIARAFDDQRLAIKELQGEVSVYGGPNSSIDFTAFEKFGMNTSKNPNPKVHYPDHRYDTGVQSYVKRSQPSHFQGNADTNKYTEGLHDVSMSILKKNIAIDAQTYTDLTKPASDGKLVIFVALPEIADQAVFNRLNDIAKIVRGRCPLFYQHVREMRSKMTRLKLAWDEDMASGFIALAPENKVRPKLRYGMVNSYRVGGVVKAATEEHRAKARNTARPKWEEFRLSPEGTRNYKTMLTEMTKKYNECTIAIREHKNPRFPVFAKWNLRDRRFDKFAPAGRENIPDLNIPVPVLPV